MGKDFWKTTSRKNIPGSVPDEIWRYLYFEDDGKNDFDKQFDNLTPNDDLNAKYGSMGQENCKIWLPNGKLFHAIAYKGDFEGWLKDIEISTKDSNLELATIQDDKIVLNNGESFLLKDCKIEDEYKIDK